MPGGEVEAPGALDLQLEAVGWWFAVDAAVRRWDLIMGAPGNAASPAAGERARYITPEDGGQNQRPGGRGSEAVG